MKNIYKNIEYIYSKQILKESLTEPSYQNIGSSLYTFLEIFKQRYPQEEEVITHWLLLIDEKMEEINSIATADMSPDEAIDTLGSALEELRSFVKDV